MTATWSPASGIPAAVTALQGQIMASDGVLLATPEYNGGIPGVFKNAIDWLSRPGADAKRMFHGRPFALMGATPGGLATAGLAECMAADSQEAAARRSGAADRLMLSHAPTLMNASGEYTDEATLKLLAEFVKGFAAFAARVRQAELNRSGAAAAGHRIRARLPGARLRSGHDRPSSAGIAPHRGGAAPHRSATTRPARKSQSAPVPARCRFPSPDPRSLRSTAPGRDADRC